MEQLIHSKPVAEYIGGGHAYVAMGAGYVNLGAELTQVRFQTINGNATLNGSSG